MFSAEAFLFSWQCQGLPSFNWKSAHYSNTSSLVFVCAATIVERLPPLSRRRDQVPRRLRRSVCRLLSPPERRFWGTLVFCWMPPFQILDSSETAKHCLSISVSLQQSLSSKNVRFFVHKWSAVHLCLAVGSHFRSLALILFILWISKFSYSRLSTRAHMLTHRPFLVKKLMCNKCALVLSPAARHTFGVRRHTCWARARWLKKTM